MSGANDAGQGAVHFINSSTRTGDGGANTYTIRNDLGTLRLGHAAHQISFDGSSFIFNNSNVGIGTTLPTGKLDVISEGSSFFRNGVGNNSVEFSATNANGGALYLRPRDGTQVVQLTTGANANWAGHLAMFSGQGVDQPDISLYSTADTTTRNVYLTSAGSSYITGGNVGIGTANPDTKFHVKAVTQYDGLAIQGNTANWIASITGLSATNDNGLLRLYNSGTAGVYLVASGSSYFNGGNVGIGTISPTAKLDVRDTNPTNVIFGGQDNTMTFYNGDGSSLDRNEIYFNTGAGADFSLRSTSSVFDIVAFDLGLPTISILKSNGNVGIGTSSSSSKLSVYTSSSTAGDSIFDVNSSGANGSVYVGTFVNSTESAGTSATGHALFRIGVTGEATKPYLNLNVIRSNSTTAYAEIKTSSGTTTNMTNLVLQGSGGNVGIGTISPLATLDTFGDLYVRNADSGFKFSAASGVNFIESASSGMLGSADLRFTNMNASTTWMAIQASTGNVGIGTATPSTKLDIFPASLGSAQGDTSFPLRFTIPNGGNNDAVDFLWQRSAATPTNWTTADFILRRNVDDTAAQNSMTLAGDASIRFTTGVTEKLRIDPNGNVGIGTTSPQSSLDVKGTIRANNSSTTDYISIYNDGGAHVAGENSSLGNLYFSGAVMHFRPTANGTTGMTLTPANNRMNFAGDDNWGIRLIADSGQYFTDIFGAYGANSGGGFRVVNRLSGADSVKMIVDYNGTGNVGIGTTSPSRKLTVSSGSIGIDNNTPIQGLDTGGTYQSLLSIGADNATYLMAKSSQPIAFHNGSERVRIDGSGNVGIGTTNADMRLDVRTTDTSGAQAQFYSDNAGGGRAGIGIRHGLAAGGLSLQQLSNGVADIANYSGSQMAFNAKGAGGSYTFNTTDSNTPRFVILNDGSVGIGTTNPGSKLEVNGNVNANAYLFGNWNVNATAWPGSGGFSYAGGDVTFGISSTTGQASLQVDGGFIQGESGKNNVFLGNVGIGTPAPSYSLQVNGSTGINIAGTNDIATLVLGPAPSGTNRDYASIIRSISNVATNYGSQLAFHTHENTSNFGDPTEKMRITANGNVGIGTASPAGKLSVYNDDWTYQADFQSSSPDVQVRIKNTAANGRSYILSSGASTGVGTSGIGVGNFGIWDETAGASRLVINSSGNVGIGTTSPTKPLEVVGGTTFETARFTNVINPGISINSISATDYKATLNFAHSGTIKWQVGVDINNTANQNFFIYDGVAADTRFYINSSGNVGIGTASPTEKLEVNGTLGVKSYLVVNGTQGSIAPLITFHRPSEEFGQIRYGTDASYDGYFHFRNVNSNTYSGIHAGMGIFDSKVGVGIASPVAQLDVLDTARISSASQDAYITLNNTSAAGHAFNVGAGGAISGGGNGFYIYDISVNLPRFTITNAGNVGIGTNAPTTALHVYNAGFGAIQVDGPANTFRVTRYSTAGTVRWDMGTTNGAESGSNAASDFYIARFNDVGTNIDFPFYIQRSSGNIGIGTVSPVAQSKLTVASSISSNAPDGDFTQGGNRAFIDFAGGVARYGGAVGGGAATQTALWANNTEVVRINSSGNVGIGTTSPVAGLDVRNSANGSSLQIGPVDTTDEGAQAVWKGAGSYGAWIQDIFQNRFRFMSNSITDDQLQIYNIGAGSASLYVQGNLTSGTPSANYQFDVLSALTGATHRSNVVGGLRTNGSGRNVTFRLSDSITNSSDISMTGNTVQLSVNGVSSIYYNDSGNVGIGTISPQSKLEVQGNVIVSNATNGSTTNVIGLNSDSTNGGYVRIRKDGTNDWYMQADPGTTQNLNFTAGSVSNAPKMVINMGGNVGIGTTSPLTKLDIGAVDGTSEGGEIHLRGAPTYKDWGMDSYQNKFRIFSTDNGAYTNWYGAFVIDGTTGSVGIGTTNPYEMLEIKATSNPVLLLHDSMTSSFKIGIDEANSGVFKIAAMDNGYGGATGDFAANDTQVLSMSVTGNVGIGTTSPSSVLQVQGSTSRQISTGATSKWADMSSSSGGYALFSSNAYLNASDNTFRYANTHSNAGGIGATGIAMNHPAWGDISFFGNVGNTTADSSFTPTSNMIIKPSGNVGIGTTAPGAKLEVNGTSAFRETMIIASGSNAFNQLHVGSTATSSGYMATYNNSAARIGFSNWWDGSTYYSGWTDGATPLQLGTNNTSRLFITASGNVGIGTASPAHPLDVNGTVNTQNMLQITKSSSQEIRFNGGSNKQWRFISTINGATNGRMDLTNSTDNFASDFTTAMSWDYSGNVGIGTTSPTFKTEISNDNSSSVLLLRNPNSSSSTTGSTVLQMRTGSDSGNANWFNIEADRTNGYVNFNSGSNYGRYVFLNGKVGIGAVPKAVSTANLETNADIILNSSGSANTIHFNSYYDNTWRAYGTGYSGALRFNTTTGDMQIWSSPASVSADTSSSIQNRMTITASGNVGIGTTTPTVPLDVIGAIRSRASTGNDGLIVYNLSAGKYWSLYPVTNGSNTDLRLWENNSGGNADRITFQAGGNVGIGTSLMQNSIIESHYEKIRLHFNQCINFFRSPRM